MLSLKCFFFFLFFDVSLNWATLCISRVVCPNFGHPSQTSTFTKHIFLQVKIALQQLRIDCLFSNYFSFRMFFLKSSSITHFCDTVCIIVFIVFIYSKSIYKLYILHIIRIRRYRQNYKSFIKFIIFMTFFLCKSTISDSFVTLTLIDILPLAYVFGHCLFLNFISEKVNWRMSKNGWRR